MVQVRNRALVLLVGTLSSCWGADSDESATRPTSSVVSATATTVSRPSEEPLLVVSLSVPSFGGYYCDGGDLVVLVAGAPGDGAAIEDLIDPEMVSSCFSRHDLTHEPQVRVEVATYDFLSLRAWRDSIADAFFEIDGARALGIDYRSNSLVLLVTPEAAFGVPAFAASFDVPSDAYRVEIVDYEIEPTTTLEDTFSPAPGGVVTGIHASGGGGPSVGCTFGFPVRRLMGNNYEYGWLTAAHCVKPTFSMASDWVYQPQYSPNSLVGVEFLDPPGWQCGSYICRNSDSAWIYGWPGPVEQRKVARTTSYSGSTTIDP